MVFDSTSSIQALSSVCIQSLMPPNRKKARRLNATCGAVKHSQLAQLTCVVHESGLRSKHAPAGHAGLPEEHPPAAYVEPFPSAATILR